MELKAKLFETLNSFFDQIYIISLKRSKDRHQLIKKNLEGLNYKMFWGVDGKNLDIENLQKEGLYHSCHTKILKKREGQHVSDLTLPQIGCALSHIRVCQDMLENKFSNALIFEDDVIIDFNIANTLQLSLNELPVDWELLYLGRHGANNDPSLLLKLQVWALTMIAKSVQNFERLRVLDPNVIQCWLPRPFSDNLDLSGYHHGAYAYAVSANGAEKILNFLFPVIQRNDNALAELCSYEWIKAFNVKEIGFFPNREIPSTINDEI